MSHGLQAQLQLSVYIRVSRISISAATSLFHLSSTKKKHWKHRYSQPFIELEVLAETRHEDIVTTYSADAFQDQEEKLRSSVVFSISVLGSISDMDVQGSLKYCKIIYLAFSFWSRKVQSPIEPVSYLPDLRGCLSYSVAIRMTLSTRGRTIERSLQWLKGRLRVKFSLRQTTSFRCSQMSEVSKFPL